MITHQKTALLAAGYFLTATFGILLSREAGGVASIWMPNGLMLGALITDWLPRRSVFACCAAANVTANWMMGSTIFASFGFTSVNMIEVGLTLLVLDRLITLPKVLLELQDLSRLSFAVLTGATAGAAANGLMISYLTGVSVADVFIAWFAADMVGNLLVTIAVIAWQSKHYRRTEGDVGGAELTALVFVVLATVWLVFIACHPITLDAFIPTLLWITLRFGLRWLTTATIGLMCLSVGFLLGGYWGPPALAADDIAGSILLIEEFVALSLIGLVPLALVLQKNARTTAQLEQNEERYRTIYNKTPVMLHSIDKQGRLINVSDFWLEKLGYQRHEVLGRRSFEFLSEDSRPKVAISIIEFQQTGSCRNISLKFVKKSGEIVEALLSATAEYDTKGEIVRSLAVIIDVTERNRAQRQLRDAIDSLQAGFALFGPDLRALAFNDRYVGLLDRCNDLIEVGVSYETLLKASFDRKQFHFDIESIDVLVQQRLHAHKIGDGTKIYQRHDGLWIEIRRHITSDGGMVSTLTDITALKGAEEELELRNIELERANADLNNFVSIASHDLKAPLRAVTFLSDMVAEDLPEFINPAKLPDQILDNLAMISSRTQRLDRMLDDILVYARLGKSAESVSAINPSTVIEEVASLHRPAAISIKVEMGMPPVDARTSLFEAICRNLISNAIKHRDAQTTELHISAATAGDKVVIRFTDDGPGIPARHRERIFELFTTLKSRDSLEATGLGLSIVKRCIELDDGTVAIEDNPQGRGTVFAISLNRAERPAFEQLDDHTTAQSNVGEIK